MDKFEITLIIIFAAVFISHPISRSARPNSIASVNLVAGTAIVIFIVYTVYSIIKSKKNS